MSGTRIVVACVLALASVARGQTNSSHDVAVAAGGTRAC